MSQLSNPSSRPDAHTTDDEAAFVEYLKANPIRPQKLADLPQTWDDYFVLELERNTRILQHLRAAYYVTIIILLLSLIWILT